MKTYFAYTRVSTVKQGQQGVSLQEQKSEIERYAHQRGLNISEWIEERETAAKVGRTIFNAMMNRLRKGEAAGVIIHKIDRSARNLRDWVEIGQLTDDGIEVHFTREALDLQSSSGRLSADVQAVVAANYIRNLREETIKGFYGRLKQGISPLPAPIGYLNAGRGKPKTIDPVRGPLVKRAFALYASGRFSHETLTVEMRKLGLRTKGGKTVGKNSIAWLLNNPFYFGLIRIVKNNQTFAGAHVPLISKKTFDTAQVVASGRRVRSPSPDRTTFLFSRLISCKQCGRSIIAEVQRGLVYYRCHSRSCLGTSIREEKIESSVEEHLAVLRLGTQELAILDRFAELKRSSGAEIQSQQLADLEIRLAAVLDRLSRLTDAFLDGHITKEMLNERKETLVSERLETEGQITELRCDSSKALARMEEFVELVKQADLLYKSGNLEEKRCVVEKTLSNRELDGKDLILRLRSELFDVGARYGDPRTASRRTFWKRWFDKITGG